MGQLSCYHISMGHDRAGSERQHDEVLEQIREDERTDLLHRMRELASSAEPADA